MRPPSRPPYSSSRDVCGGEATVGAGVRRVADEVGRLEPGRELFRRLAPGRVLAVDAVRGLAVVPFVLAADLAAPDLALSFRAALPFRPESALAVAALAVPDFAGPALAPPARLGLDFAPLALPPDLAMLALPAPPLTAPALPTPALTAPDLTVPALAMPALPAPDLTVLASARAEVRFLAPFRDAEALLACLVTGRDWADRAGAAGPATDSVFAAMVRALAAELIALVAVFMDCMAVDIVFADEVALVAAAFILDAAEVTLVAAEDTVLAAVADVGLERAAEVRVLPDRAGVRAALRRVLVAAVPLALRAGRVAGRTDDLVPVDLAATLVVGRAAERLAALVLTDRALPALAGLRRADARVVV
jgi:hypothetical protein